ncbi:MAG: serine hydrolase [Pseudomonadota bacterium]
MFTVRNFLPVAACIISALLPVGGAAGTDFDGSLESLLNSDPARFGTVMADPARYRLQIIYTQIDRDADNQPAFRSFTFRLDENEYFYPASTVKLPTAVLALEKLRQLNIDGLDRNTPMLTGVADDVQTPAISDETSHTGLPSVGHYVRKILLVSDNDAYNRLYEFLGQEPLNEALGSRGFGGTWIQHRLAIVLDPAANARTNPVVFVNNNRVIYRQDAMTGSDRMVCFDAMPLGQAEIIDGERVAKPKDFSTKNRYPLATQLRFIKALMFPDSMDPESRLALGDDDYRFLYANLSGYPTDSGIAAYDDAAEYPDGYVKFLMFGGTEQNIPDNIRIYNKVGNAYGFLTDAAYIVDFDAGVEFLLAATIYVNENQTFNDDQYEYDEIGLPFLRDLGQAIYQVELRRARPNRPDLSRLIN